MGCPSFINFWTFANSVMRYLPYLETCVPSTGMAPASETSSFFRAYNTPRCGVYCLASGGAFRLPAFPHSPHNGLNVAFCGGFLLSIQFYRSQKALLGFAARAVTFSAQALNG